MCRDCIPTSRTEWIRYCGCGCRFRQFLTLEEKIEMLKDYKTQLQKEIAGVEERIKELRE